MHIKKFTRRSISSLKHLLANRHTRQVFGMVALVFVLANLTVYTVYHGRTYPNTVIASQHIGSISHSGLAKKISVLPLLPKNVTFTQDKAIFKSPLADFDLSADTSALTQQTMQTRNWLPVANFFTGHTIPLQIKSDPVKVQETLQKLLVSINRVAADATITKQDATVSIKAESDGVEVDDKATATALLTALEHGQASVVVAVTHTKPKVTSQSLQAQLTTIHNQLKTSITLQYEGKTKQLSASEMAALYTEEGSGLVLSDAAIQSNIIAVGSGFGISTQNLAAATAAIKTAITNQKNLSFTLEARPFAKTLAYCTAVRGVSESELAPLATQLQETFADSRGWNLGGTVKFQHVTSGCDFTVWLAAADQMPGFGAICDAEWNCSVGPNVVLNYDRWRFTTSSWQSAKAGTLWDYRAMSINHETGHWFGFYHDVCPGPGQLAPVMQQQSVDLQGCVFNPWPTAKEQAVLKQKLGI